MGYTVGELAEVAHVTVRTLHHYDEIGLLEPSGRSEAGYRLYDDEDAARLHQIMLFRELGFDLAHVKSILDDADYDRRDALLRQREMLEAKASQLLAMIDAVSEAIAHDERGTTMKSNDMFDAFDDFDPSTYEDEVKERWGESEAYSESARRTSKYTKEDWERFKVENEEVNLVIVALIDEGVSPSDHRAVEAVERARLLIDHWFYPCSRRMHAELGEMYVADARFTQTYEKMRPDMAQYLRDATAANAARDEE
jgi:DNA-binding transcriptional MerR regulator